MSRKVYLHIGAPKTGTTYLQDRLSVNARSLAEHGVHFPTGSPIVGPALFQFRAALDLLGQDWGGPPGHAVGAWETLVRRVRRRSGTVVISHEILAPASPAEVDRVMRDLAGAEIHVVYTARDLARQIPAGWQESVKQGRGWSYRRFLDRFEKGRVWFSRAFDVPRVLSTWGAGLPPEHVHVVTVPRSRAHADGEDTLWLRMCQALGIDPAWAPVDSDHANPSLGMAEVQIVRKLNRQMDRGVGRDTAHDALIRKVLAQGELAHRKSAPVRLPPERYPWVEDQVGRWIEWIQGAGVHVIGDLEELRPVRPGPDERWQDPDRVSAKSQLKTAMAALEVMTREAARREAPEDRLVSRVRKGARRLRG